MNKNTLPLQSIRGMSLVEILVGIAILLLVFLTLFASFQAMLTFAERNKLRANALFLANEHIEMIRALPYDSVGTVAGLPSGTIPQNETITFDGHNYNRRTFIQYVDDAADGTGASDTLAADYKRAKVELSYFYQGATSTFAMVTNIAPKSQESLTGAGVLRVNVNDADNNPVPSAEVHVLNNTVATSVDITTYTNASGTISFPGAWAGSGYEIYVSKPGYSSAQTYTATTSNPNPSPSPLNVAENSTTEIFWKIDLLSTLDVYTRSWPTHGTFVDLFDDASNVATQTDTQISGGSLLLNGSSGSYSLSGNSVSVSIAPASLGSWVYFDYEDVLPPSTSLSFQFEYNTGGGVYALIPDTDLPSNSTGFTTTPVDLHDLDTSTYADIRIVTNLATTDQNVTPEVLEYSVIYLEPDLPVANTDFTLISGATIGTSTSSDPIYRYDKTHQTPASGRWESGDMVFDIYELTLPSASVGEACPSLPVVLEPDTDLEQTLTLVSPGVNNLELQVNSPSGGSVSNAVVHIVGGTDDVTRVTGPCGVVYFPSISATTYDVSIKTAGYQYATTTVAVSGTTEETVTLSY